MSAPVIDIGLSVQMPKSGRVLTVMQIRTDGRVGVIGYEQDYRGDDILTWFGPGCFERRIQDAKVIRYAHEAREELV